MIAQSRKEAAFSWKVSLFGAANAFKLNPTGQETVLHNFGGASTDGVLPQAGLVEDATGNFYGTTLRAAWPTWGQCSGWIRAAMRLCFITSWARETAQLPRQG